MHGFSQPPAPGMQDAHAIVTSRVMSIDGKMTTQEYIDLLREIMADNPGAKQEILVSALASLSAALVRIAASHSNQTTDELLVRVGMSLTGVAS